MDLPIYLDFNATTPVADEVIEAVQPFLFAVFGNPSSSHRYGRIAAEGLAQARHQVAQLIGANDDEIIFTANATEANNLALLGVTSALSARGSARRQIVVSAIEHPAVMEPAKHLKTQGWALEVLPVDAMGQVSEELAKRVVGPATAIVSVMHANNEIGTVQPVRAIAAIASDAGALMHTDASQSLGKISVNVDDLGVDLLTIAGHKLYAPKGVGALYVRRGTPITSISFGATQERGLRPGTENVALAVGLGAAADLARRTLEKTGEVMQRRRDNLHEQLAELVPGLRLNGHPTDRLPNTLNVSFPRVDGARLLAACSEVAASTGSACHSGTEEVSGVLASMGIPYEHARGAVRLSVGRSTTEQEVEKAAVALASAWRRLVSR